uniref:HD domain-containing protein n=1 Tax=Pundamilia nyererei TaxID=303518 RepID=A0A3B4EUB0_9CICH
MVYCTLQVRKDLNLSWLRVGGGCVCTTKAGEQWTSMLAYHCLKKKKQKKKTELNIKRLRPATCYWERAGNSFILFFLSSCNFLSSSLFLTQVFNDPIHGHIELHPLLVKIIDTPQFQRLRNIKQLGGVYFVYPGASHNRFEHSIGVAYLAGELAKALKVKQPELDINERDVLCVQIAGLCHDLGHGPFSHFFDGMFMPEAGDKKWKHEEASIKMFDYLLEENGLKPHKQYPGREKEKSFLYEIVSNKETGIDVDKFDYFARDCHHLGIQNNFDHQRFIMFARVCDVNGSKHICSRDKEIENMYDIFHTRHSIHRRACQHKIKMAVEIMIKDALLLADKDPYIQIEISNGNGTSKKVPLSKAKDKMEAYMKLTDQVIERILNSSSDSLKEAREILHRVMTRDLYRCVGQATVCSYVFMYVPVLQEMTESLKKLVKDIPEGGEDEFVIINVTLDYGMEDNDPISKAFFYRKDKPDKAIPISKSKVSKLLPEHFSDEILRVYWKNHEGLQEKERKNKEKEIKKFFRTQCKDYGPSTHTRRSVLPRTTFIDINTADNMTHRLTALDPS